jgi:hypothetical protein
MDVINLVFICLCSAFIATFVLDWKLRKEYLQKMLKTNSEYQETLLKIRDISDGHAKAMAILEERITACEFASRKR